jgi:hypothetical protein
VPEVPAFALESDCGNPLSKPLLACVAALPLFAVEAPLDPVWADGVLLEVVDAFFAEDLLDPVLPELVCAKATALISRAVPRAETIIFITQSPSPKIQSGGKLDASRTRREVSPELPIACTAGLTLLSCQVAYPHLPLPTHNPRGVLHYRSARQCRFCDAPPRIRRGLPSTHDSFFGQRRPAASDVN